MVWLLNVRKLGSSVYDVQGEGVSPVMSKTCSGFRV
jgi:hypothetical protein